MRLKDIKDCKTCDKAIVFGSNDAPTVKCNSDNYEHTKLFRELGRHCAGQCGGYNISNGIRSGELNQRQALRFMLAGNSEFIMHSTKNNEDYIFNLVKEASASDKEKYIYFVNIIHGHEKTYAGILIEDDYTHEFEFKQGKNGNINKNDISIKSLVFVINKMIKKETVGNLRFYHVGKCGCCGASLVTSEHIHNGYCKLHQSKE